MKTIWLRAAFNCRTVALMFVLALSVPAFSQDLASFAILQPAIIEPAPAVKAARSETLPEEPGHKFWDRENRILLTGVAVSSAADFAVTYSNLRNGGRELNPVTRLFSGSTPGLAMNFVGETVGVVGLSYFFHKTGHHKLERIVSMTNIGASMVAVSYGLAHR